MTAGLCWAPLLQGEGLALKEKPQKINLVVIHKHLESQSEAGSL